MSIIASLGEQDLSVGQVTFSVSRAQLLVAGVTADATRLLVRASRVSWPAGEVADVVINTAVGWGAVYTGLRNKSALKGSPDARLELSVQDASGALIPVLNLAPLVVQVDIRTPIRTALVVEAL